MPDQRARGEADADILALRSGLGLALVDLGKPVNRNEVICWLAYKEAKALMEGQPPPASGQNSLPNTRSTPN